MKALYLIFSHEHQEQLVRLTTTIRKLSPHAQIAIHHDPSKEPLNTSIFPSKTRVHIVPNPIAAEWGDFSQVEQYIHALSWARENLDFDWIFTITGLTYPIKCLRDFERHIEKSNYDAFIYHFDAFDPTHWPEGTAKTRYLFRYYKLPRFVYYYKIPENIRNTLESWRKSLNEKTEFIRIVPRPRGAKTRIGFRRLKTPFHERFKLQGGRQELNINKKALNSILDFIDKNPWWTWYCTRCLNPDECFFNTILANDPNLKIANTVLRYVKWPKKHAASVAAITSPEIPEVLRNESPFALKLDSRMDPRALDLIDEYLASCFQD